jgi:hypothetical protein
VALIRRWVKAAKACGVGFAGDQRFNHPTTGQANDVGGDRVELDVGVLRRLLQPLDVTAALAHQLLPGRQQCAHLLGCWSAERFPPDRQRPPTEADMHALRALLTAAAGDVEELVRWAGCVLNAANDTDAMHAYDARQTNGRASPRQLLALPVTGRQHSPPP